MLKAIVARCVIVGLFFCLCSTNAFAADVFIKDINGKPIPNAVLGLDKSQFVLNQSSGQSELGTLASPQVMDQIDFSFVPRVLVVNKNDWVSFPNSDDVRHHVYSFSKPLPFEIKMFKGSNSSPVQFSQQGIVVLGCNIHDSMIGYIYIREDEYAYISDQSGKITLDVPKLNNNDQVLATIWHPQLSVSASTRISTTISPQLASQTITLDITLAEQPDTTKESAGDRFRNKFNRTQK